LYHSLFILVTKLNSLPTTIVTTIMPIFLIKSRTALSKPTGGVFACYICRGWVDVDNDVTVYGHWIIHAVMAFPQGSPILEINIEVVFEKHSKVTVGGGGLILKKKKYLNPQVDDIRASAYASSKKWGVSFPEPSGLNNFWRKDTNTPFLCRGSGTIQSLEPTVFFIFCMFYAQTRKKNVSVRKTSRRKTFVVAVWVAHLARPVMDMPVHTGKSGSRRRRAPPCSLPK